MGPVTNTALFRRSLVVPVLIAVGFGVTACSGDASGGSGSTTAPSSTASNPIAAVDPCRLLTQSDVTQLGLTPNGPDNTAKSRGCAWNKGTSYSVGIYANGSQGLDELRANNSTTASLQSHDAIQIANSNMDCVFDIAISRTSSVDITVEAGTGNACQIATQYATLIEPKLPAQQK